jgi:predicted metal-dependent hydrolase
MINDIDIKLIRENRVSIALKIMRDGRVVVRAPHLIPKKFIDDFINKHSRMIEKNRKLIIANTPVKKRYIDGEKFLYLGNEYVFTPALITEIKLADGKLLFPKALLFRAEKEIENWYVGRARETISRLVYEYAKLMNTTFTELRFSDTSSKWGSCTRDNRLQFNWRLIMTPLIVARYVVIHELAHTMEKNHKRIFWSIVRTQNPSYKQQIKWLAQHGNKLIV